MNKELDLEIYDIVKIEEGNGCTYLESINEIHNDENGKLAFTDNFVIDLKKVEVNCVLDGNPYQLEMVWRLDGNRNYTMIYPIQRLESIDNAKPSEALECLEKIKIHLFERFKNEKCNEDFIKGYEKVLFEPIKQALLKAQEQDKVLSDVEKVKSGKTIIHIGKDLIMMNKAKYYEYLENENEPVSKRILQAKCEEQEKVLEILKNKVDFVFYGKSKEIRLRQTDGESDVFLMNETGDTLLPEQEFDLLKRGLYD